MRLPVESDNRDAALRSSQLDVQAAALSSRIAQMSLIDALYLLVARHKRVSLRKVERLNSHTEEMLRFPTK